MNATDVLVYGMILARLSVGIKLTQVAVQKKMRNLLWLAIAFNISGIFYIFGISSTYNLLLLRLNGLGAIFIVLFTSETFYQDRKSPLSFFMGLILVCLGANLILTLAAPDPLSVPGLIGSGFMGLMGAASWSWHGYAANQGYRLIATEKGVANWIKIRYQYILAYSAFAVLASMLSIFQPFNNFGVNAFNGLLLIVVIVMQLLVWGMPEPFRRYLNRNYHSENTNQTVEHLTEEEIMQRMAEK